MTRRVILEDHGYSLIEVGEDYSRWPKVNRADVRATFWLIVAVLLFIAICAVEAPQ